MLDDRWNRLALPKPEALPTIDIPEWLAEATHLDAPSARNWYITEAETAARALRSGSEFVPHHAARWRPYRQALLQLANQSGSFWKNEDGAKEAPWQRLVILPCACATLAAEALLVGEKTSALEWTRCAYRVIELLGRGDLWLSRLLAASAETMMIQVIHAIVESEREDPDFLATLLEQIPNDDPFDVFERSKAAEYHYASSHPVEDITRLFTWSRYRRVSTFIAIHFAGLLLGRVRVATAFASYSMPSLIRSLEYNICRSTPGTETIRKMQFECRDEVAAPFQLLRIEFPSHVAAVLCALLRQATIRNIFRSAIHKYIAGRDQSVPVERDWFATEPLQSHESEDGFQIRSQGDGLNPIVGATSDQVFRRIAEFRW